MPDFPFDVPGGANNTVFTKKFRHEVLSVVEVILGGLSPDDQRKLKAILSEVFAGFIGTSHAKQLNNLEDFYTLIFNAPVALKPLLPDHGHYIFTYVSAVIDELDLISKISKSTQDSRTRTFMVTIIVLQLELVLYSLNYYKNELQGLDMEYAAGLQYLLNQNAAKYLDFIGEDEASLPGTITYSGAAIFLVQNALAVITLALHGEDFDEIEEILDLHVILLKILQDTLEDK